MYIASFTHISNHFCVPRTMSSVLQRDGEVGVVHMYFETSDHVRWNSGVDVILTKAAQLQLKALVPGL